MASNSFGVIFKITTWGESHGKAMGVVIDGCPAGLSLEESDIYTELAWRAPGRNTLMSPRIEPDKPEILSGVFDGKTTGAPISILIPNSDADSSKYEPIKNLLRPGHANYTYLEKYGIFDYRGNGRASARETVCRVAAGAIAKKLLSHYGIKLVAYLKQIGTVSAKVLHKDITQLIQTTKQSAVFCPEAKASETMIKLIEETKERGDSLGGIVEFVADGLPTGLGDPIYEKLEANLAHAMLSLPATKGFEIGSGFQSVLMNGSEHNDIFIKEEGIIRTKTNHAGGTLGGISNGMPLVGRVAFKPTSSISHEQETLTLEKEAAAIKLPSGSRNDPCVAIRAVPVVEAMAALVLADSLLLNKCSRL
jgi:chorismate synthase